MLTLVVLIAAFCWCASGAFALAFGRKTHRRWNATFVGWLVGFMGACLLDNHLRELRGGHVDSHIIEQAYVSLMLFLVLVGFGSALAYLYGLFRKRREERKFPSPP